MSGFGKVLGTFGWLAFGSLLTLLFYLPFWLAVGMVFYPHIHPDFWQGPATLLPILLSPLAASLLVTLIARKTR